MHCEEDITDEGVVKAKGLVHCGFEMQHLTRHRRGTRSLSVPLSKSRSFNTVKSVFKMALLALKISSTKATLALGK